jgi:phosphatidylserine decarboxylase
MSIFLQKLIPQHLFSRGMGWLAQIRTPWIKNWMIHRFIRIYQVDMSAAIIENPESYPDFNHFFIRELKPSLRPIATDENGIISPVDGSIAQIGKVSKNQLLQAKGFYFDLETLLGGDSALAQLFYDGSFTTIYLAPRDYHRVHMPLTGKLVKSIYLPGKLFSVNKMTSEIIPELYARNERLVTLFDTTAGPMAVILVGAMIVGNIQTVWMNKPVRSNKPEITLPSTEIHLQKGAELGHFTLGSTVIVLFGKNKTTWSNEIHAESIVKIGQLLGNISLSSNTLSLP